MFMPREGDIIMTCCVLYSLMIAVVIRLVPGSRTPKIKDYYYSSGTKLREIIKIPVEEIKRKQNLGSNLSHLAYKRIHKPTTPILQTLPFVYADNQKCYTI